MDLTNRQIDLLVEYSKYTTGRMVYHADRPEVQVLLDAGYLRRAPGKVCGMIVCGTPNTNDLVATHSALISLTDAALVK